MALSRRAFLGGTAAAGAGVALAAGGAVTDALLSQNPDAAADTPASTAPPFHGVHQSGVVEDATPAASFLAFDLIVSSKTELMDLFQVLTARARLLTSGGAPVNLGPGVPPDDNGILGPSLPPDELAVTLGIGASVFDDRFGLATRKPARLTTMTAFPNDNLDPAQTGGDLSIQLRAANTDTLIHAMRDITKHTRGAMQPRWRVDGALSPPRPSGTPRNYMGFKDGIANPNVSESSVTESLIWVQPGGQEPEWAAGGTYQVIRIIRMLVEFWDRVSLQEQETMIGRRRDSGAPLDGNKQSDIPDYAKDPQGAVIPLTAHIRLANPRTTASEPSQILRRGWNYDRGIDVNGNLDQGLVFTCYQQDLERQFITVQTRLIDEPLVDYISPTGGGYFFVLPGVSDDSDYYGRSLLG